MGTCHCFCERYERCPEDSLGTVSKSSAGGAIEPKDAERARELHSAHYSHGYDEEIGAD